LLSKLVTEISEFAGDIDWQTHKGLEFREFQVSRQQMKVMKDTLGPEKGSFGDYSEFR